ncbi:MAG: glycosyltransferase family 2 protein [Halobacteriovoraceae bacterium]|nr:glycosyltransferase family 2 protein [Halobacteriovoraceae bacterium]
MGSLVYDITFAITTYNRPEMLKECVQSILDQTEANFKIIIGNDYISVPINSEDIGSTDQRIKIINYKNNLGEIGNMREMLNLADTKYFSYIADDDLLHPNFLKAVNDAINEYSHPDYIFPLIETFIDKKPIPHEIYQLKQVDKSEYLSNFLNRNWYTQGCIGVYNTEKLREIDGMEKVGKKVSLGSDTLLGVKASLLDKLVFISTPMYFFRYHDQSLSTSNNDVKTLYDSQIDVITKSLIVLNNDFFSTQKNKYIYSFLKWQILDYYTTYTRQKKFNGFGICSYFFNIFKFSKDLNLFYKVKLLKQMFILAIKTSIKSLKCVLENFFKKSTQMKST